MDITYASPKRTRSGDSGISSRPRSDREPSPSHAMRMFAKPSTRAGRLALQLEQMEEEYAIEQRAIEVERRALALEREALRAKYVLLREKTTNKAVRHTKADDVDNKPSSDGSKQHAHGRAASLLKNNRPSSLQSVKPINRLLQPICTETTDRSQFTTGTQQQIIGAFPVAVLKEQSTVITSNNKTNEENFALSPSHVEESSTRSKEKLSVTTEQYVEQANIIPYNSYRYIDQQQSISARLEKFQSKVDNEGSTSDNPMFSEGNTNYGIRLQHRAIIHVCSLGLHRSTQRATVRVTVDILSTDRERPVHHPAGRRVSLAPNPDTGQRMRTLDKILQSVYNSHLKFRQKFFDINMFPLFIRANQKPMMCYVELRYDVQNNDCNAKISTKNNVLITKFSSDARGKFRAVIPMNITELLLDIVRRELRAESQLVSNSTSVTVWTELTIECEFNFASSLPLRMQSTFHNESCFLNNNSYRVGLSQLMCLTSDNVKVENLTERIVSDVKHIWDSTSDRDNSSVLDGYVSTKLAPTRFQMCGSRIYHRRGKDNQRLRSNARRRSRTHLQRRRSERYYTSSGDSRRDGKSVKKKQGRVPLDIKENYYREREVRMLYESSITVWVFVQSIMMYNGVMLDNNTKLTSMKLSESLDQTPSHTKMGCAKNALKMKIVCSMKFSYSFYLVDARQWQLNGVFVTGEAIGAPTVKWVMTGGVSDPLVLCLTMDLRCSTVPASKMQLAHTKVDRPKARGKDNPQDFRSWKRVDEKAHKIGGHDRSREEKCDECKDSLSVLLQQLDEVNSKQQETNAM